MHHILLADHLSLPKYGAFLMQVQTYFRHAQKYVPQRPILRSPSDSRVLAAILNG